jgi:MFS family permease
MLYRSFRGFIRLDYSKTMGLPQFLRSNYRLIGFGFGTSLVGTFGQTLAVSFFIPYFVQEFVLSQTEVGWIYGGATLLSALSLPWATKKIDTMRLSTFSLWVTLGLSVGCLSLATVNHPFWLFLSIYLLRFCGQGLMSHMTSVSVLRGFEKYRGRALSLAWLGSAVGEAILPAVMTAIALNWGWKMSWVFASGLVGVVVPLLVRWGLSRGERGVESFGEQESESSQPKRYRQWQRSEVLKDALFWPMVLASILPPFVLTGVILFQLPLADERGWSHEWIATSYIGYAICRVAGSFLSGWMIDRVTAARWLPFTELPLATGLLIVAFSDHPVAYTVFICLTGLSIGQIGNTKSAFWSEVYGVRHIGAIRGVLVASAIVATAVAPILFGHIVGKVSWFWILTVSGVGMLISSFFIFFFSTAFRFRRANEVIPLDAADPALPVST